MIAAPGWVGEDGGQRLTQRVVGPAEGATSARRELLAIQKRLWRRLVREIEGSLDASPPNVDIYQEEYERDVRRYEAISSKAELVEACAAADVVYVGDYHSLPQSQQTLVKLLLGVAKTRPEVVLCMELVDAERQDALDRFMDDRIDEERFLRELDYERTWGFPWAPYRDAFEVARRHGIRVLGINSDPRDHEHDHLLQRDFDAARVIVDAIEAQPEALVVVFDGDLHVARDHLPLIVDTVLRERRLPDRRSVIVHQNAEEIYWKLAREAKEEDVNVVRLGPDAYCVLNASPFEKVHSYLNWVSERETLEPPTTHSVWTIEEAEEDDDEDDDPGDDRGAEYAEQVLQIVQAIARFLGIERDDLDAFELFTVNDLDFLDYLDQGGLFSEAEREDVKRQILSNESYFIPKAKIIYLSDFSVANAAEEGTHFLHYLTSGYRWSKPRHLVTDFYFRAVTEALGFFGSRLIVPTRECWTEADCEQFVAAERERERERSRRRRAIARGEALAEPADPDAATSGEVEKISTERVTIAHNRAMVLKASRLVLRHKKQERRYLDTGDWTSAGPALTQPAEIHLLLTHMLGHMLGAKLFAALVAGLVGKDTIRSLFHERLEKKGVALDVYLELVRLTAPIAHGARSERL